MLQRAAWLVALLPAVTSIGCYVCSSEAGSDRECEDPFHRNTTGVQYQALREAKPSKKNFLITESVRNAY